MIHIETVLEEQKSKLLQTEVANIIKGEFMTKFTTKY